MWVLGHRECWVLKNWYFQIVVLEETVLSPLHCKEMKPVNPKGNQSWIFIGRTDAEAEAPILWPPDAENWPIGKDPNAGKDQKQGKRTEDEMVGWHHQLNGHEFEHDLGDGEGQGSLVCCSPWGHKELDTTEWLNFAYKLHKQGDNIQPWRTPFPIWNQSVVPRPVLTVAYWPAYRFLRRLDSQSHVKEWSWITSSHCCCCYCC